jgi:MFS family permease
MHIALTHHRFGRLLAALAASQLGDWLYNLALLACVQERTHSTAWLGITTAARIGPMVLGGPLGGLLADRVDRRALMIAADAARAGLMAVLVVVAATSMSVILIPLLAAAVTLAGTSYPSCVAAVTPRLVPEGDLMAANAARGTITPACVAAGPVLGALLLLIGPPDVVFAIDALTFVVSAALVASIPAAALGRSREARSRGARSRQDVTRGRVRAALVELGQGARALRAAPEAGRMVAADVAGSFVYGAQTVLLLLVAERLGLHADGYGYLLAAQGVGGICGATLAGRLGRAAERRSTLAAGLVMVAVPLPLLALTGSVAVALILGVIAGAGALLVEVVVDARLQQTLDEARLGCAYGFAFAASVGGIAIGALVAPALVALLGVDVALVVIGATVLALAVVTVGLPLRRRLVLEQPDALGDARGLHA